MDSSLSVFALLATLAAVILVALVLSALLLLNKKTRAPGVILLVVIFLVGAMFVAVGAYLVPLGFLGYGSPPGAEPRSVRFNPTVASQGLAPVAAQADQRDEAGEHGDRSDRAKQPPAADPIEPEAPQAQPDAKAEAGRLLPHRGDRRLNG